MSANVVPAPTDWLESLWAKTVVTPEVRSFFDGLFDRFLSLEHTGSIAALITGDPGTGKTHFLKTLAQKCGLPVVFATQDFFLMRYRQRFHMRPLQERPTFVADWFEELRNCRAGLAIVEEIEWTTRHPDTHEPIPPLADEFIAQWDAHRSRGDQRILLLATSLVPSAIDPRMMQRFEHRIDFGSTDAQMRCRLLQAFLLESGLSTEVPDFVEQELVQAHGPWLSPLTHRSIQSLVYRAARYGQTAPRRIDETAWREALDEKYEDERRRHHPSPQA